MTAQKKRHHFVPVTYLRGFTDHEGFLQIARKDEPHRGIRLRPSETAFRNYYYSQPVGDGSMNHNALEDVFSTFENPWPRIVQVLASGREQNSVLGDLLTTVGFQRVRVPAFRDAVEQSLELYAREKINQLKQRGQIPAPPPDVPNILDLVEVTIDPHQSIHAMKTLLRQIGPVLDSFGYQVAHNDTDLDFITSDNPVSYYAMSESCKMTPYPLRITRDCELVFPITSRMALLGSAADRARFARHGLKSVRIRDREKIRRLNRVVAKFGYEALFSRTRLPAVFVERFAQSPVLKSDSEGFHPDELRMPEFSFGPRRKLLKWRYEIAGNSARHVTD